MTSSSPCKAFGSQRPRLIASHFGEACGAFFRFHSTLLLISVGRGGTQLGIEVISLACYAPLLVMQVIDHSGQHGTQVDFERCSDLRIGQNWCGSSSLA